MTGELGYFYSTTCTPARLRMNTGSVRLSRWAASTPRWTYFLREHQHQTEKSERERERERQIRFKWEKARIGDVAAMQTGGGESVFILSMTRMYDIEQTELFWLRYFTRGILTLTFFHLCRWHDGVFYPINIATRHNIFTILQLSEIWPFRVMLIVVQ